MPHTVPILSCNREHRLVWLFHSEPLLTDFLSVGREDRSWLICNKDSRMLASVIADSAVLPCRNASGMVGNNGISIHINEIQSCFAAPRRRKLRISRFRLTAKSSFTPLFLLSPKSLTTFRGPRCASGCLRTGYSAWRVDSCSLRSGDKLLKIFRIAAGERKYPSGTSSSKTCDNVQPSSLLRDSEICAVMHTPFEIIPQLSKRGEDGSKRPAAVMR